MILRVDSLSGAVLTTFQGKTFTHWNPVMRRHFTLLLLASTLLVACSGSETGSTQVSQGMELDTERNPVRFRVGDSWTYRQHRWIGWDDSGPKLERSFIHCRAIGDTVIAGMPFVLIDQMVRVLVDTGVEIRRGRMAVHSDDTLLIYSSNLMGSSGSAALLPAGRMAGVVDSLLDDVSASGDFFLSLRFPLKREVAYVIRKPSKYDSLLARYEGIGVVRTPVGNFAAWQFQRESSLATNVNFRMWLDARGLLMRTIDDSDRYVDSDGTVLQFVEHDTTVYLGTADVPADSLKPLRQR